jgi:hypothetical protein
VTSIKENILPLILNCEHAKNPMSEVKGTEFNFTFNPKLAQFKKTYLREALKDKNQSHEMNILRA